MVSSYESKPDPRMSWWWFGPRCEGGSCVEVASAGDGVAMRDSKDQSGPILRFTQDEWSTFLTGAKAGEFDHLR